MTRNQIAAVLAAATLLTGTAAVAQAPAARTTTHATVAAKPAAKATTTTTTAAKPAAAPMMAKKTTTTVAARPAAKPAMHTASANGRMVTTKTATGKTITYNCSKGGNANKKACS